MIVAGAFWKPHGNSSYCSDYGACGSGYGQNGCGPAGCGIGGRGDGGLLGGGLACRDGSCGSCPGGRFPGLSGGCSLLSGNAMRRLMGPFAPYSEGCGSQRWFDFYAGATAYTRSSKWGGIGSTQQVFETGQFLTTNVISSVGTGTPAVPPPNANTPGQVAQPGTPALLVSSLDMDKYRAGLELIGNVLIGPGSNIEVRYFGLNKWSDSRQVINTAANLFSVFSQWGTDPALGFDDTDRSLIHRISYTSKFDNGEVNYRRRWMGNNPAFQGSWLGGIRYFELDEKFGFAAIGSTNNTFAANTLRFFNMDTKAQNHLVGFQVGGDFWTTIVPGISVGNELKGGIYNNNINVNSKVVSNSITAANENLARDRAAFLVEYNAQAIYRMTYSWTLRGGYNLLYIDNVALAPENFNSRLTTVTPPAAAAQIVDFGANRFPFINANGHALYHGFNFGAEYMW
ncbi:MAG: BBP7 family outer membrane beta-barrel protein [Pirellulales bacterium]